MVCITHKAAYLTNTVCLYGNIYIRIDLLNNRTVSFKVSFTVDTADRADNTADIIDLSVHNYLTENSEALDCTGSDFTEEAKPCSAAFNIKTLDGVILSVKDTAEIVAVLTCGADGCPRSVFKVDICCENCICCSVNSVYIVCVPEEVTAVFNLIITVFKLCRLISTALRTKAVFIFHGFIVVDFIYFAVDFAAFIANSLLGTGRCTT